MTDKIICEKCGCEMQSLQSDLSLGMKCPNCGWGWITTINPPIFEDNEEYHIILLSNDNSQNIIKILSKIMCKNYLETKKIIEKAPIEIFHGKAIDVKNIKEKLKEKNIKIKIEPNFIY